jgi:hypothetical protein
MSNGCPVREVPLNNDAGPSVQPRTTWNCSNDITAQHGEFSYYILSPILVVTCFSKFKLLQNLVGDIHFCSRMGSHALKSSQTLTLVLLSKRHYCSHITIMNNKLCIKVNIKHLHSFFLLHIHHTGIFLHHKKFITIIGSDCLVINLL